MTPSEPVLRSSPPIVGWSPHAFSYVENHGRRSWPGEACGILGGTVRSNPSATVWHIRAALQVPNHTTGDPGSAFAMAPHHFARAEAALRRQGLRLLGFFHTHPHGPARPSPSDLANHWPGHLMVIAASDPASDPRDPEALVSWWPHGRSAVRCPEWSTPPAIGGSHR